MQPRLPVIRLALSLLTIVILSGLNSHAQSSLFNIPTTDVLDKDSTYIEVDLDAHPSGNAEDRWQSFGAMTIRGVGKRSEVGLNIYATRTSEGFEPLELQPNFKFNIYQNEARGFAFSTGATGYLPLTRRLHRDASVSIYAVASKTFKANWTPRLTGGGYQLIGRNPENTDARGFLVGIEQPVMKRLTFIADWNTAKNRFGYAAAGFGLNITKRSSLYSAYYLGNSGRGNNSLGIYYGLSF